MKDVNTSFDNKWTRSSNGKFFGVCEGLGRSFDIEPWVLRATWLISVLFLGFGFLLYLILAFALPIQGYEYQAKESKILGVCHRIHLKTNLEIGLVRALCILLGISTLGATLVGYIVLHFVLSDPDLRAPNSF